MAGKDQISAQPGAHPVGAGTHLQHEQRSGGHGGPHQHSQGRPRRPAVGEQLQDQRQAQPDRPRPGVGAHRHEHAQRGGGPAGVLAVLDQRDGDRRRRVAEAVGDQQPADRIAPPVPGDEQAAHRERQAHRGVRHDEGVQGRRHSPAEDHTADHGSAHFRERHAGQRHGRRATGSAPRAIGLGSGCRGHSHMMRAAVLLVLGADTRTGREKFPADIPGTP